MRHALWLCCLCVALGPVTSRAADKEPAFPFPVEIDNDKGKTGIYPNRVHDRDTDMWYVYVPGGKYRIGSNQQPDSKSIEVTMTGFYISGKPVSCARYGRYLDKEKGISERQFDVPSIELLIKLIKGGHTGLRAWQTNLAVQNVLGQAIVPPAPPMGSLIPSLAAVQLADLLPGDWKDWCPKSGKD